MEHVARITFHDSRGAQMSLEKLDAAELFHKCSTRSENYERIHKRKFSMVNTANGHCWHLKDFHRKFHHVVSHTCFGLTS